MTDRETGYTDSPCTDCGQHDARHGGRCDECHGAYLDALEPHAPHMTCDCDVCGNTAWCDWCGDVPATTDRGNRPICAACDAKEDEREGRNPPVRSWERD